MKPSPSSFGPNRPRTQSENGRRVRKNRSWIPYNPGLHKLIEAKQAGSEPLGDKAMDCGFRGWHQRGYLPHYDAPGVTQLVTMRLMDSLPLGRRGEWEMLFRIENNPERRRQLEAYLDRGLGECWLGQSAIAALADSALRFFNGKRYQLVAWVVMPNHLHLVLRIWDVPLLLLVKSWKSFIARGANAILGRNGTFWERDYWDTLIKDEAHLLRAVRYVERNPTKAKLVLEPREWRWSSARFRDEFGVLRMPGGYPRS